ncbi:MAG: hypothetical protein RID42_08295 [Alphaproteobacteria bacterium]
MVQFSRFYQTIVSNDVTLFFSTIMVVWFLLALLVLLPRLARLGVSAKFAAMTPNSLATLGVLGTFTGILIGLLDFDVARIDDSVPQLLAGLKTAFTTSIVGIFGAILFRLIRTIIPNVDSSEGVTPGDIHAALVDIRDDGRASSARTSDLLTELRKSISSDGDSSLLTQVQKLRTTVQDGQGELIREFRDFAKHMVENNQKAIIEALEQVIRDFNEKLTEQFGENFKQLNEAVSSLVVWQDKYREHVEALETRLDAAVQALESTQQSLESVRTHAEKIPEAIQPLGPVMKGVNGQIEVMTAHLEAIAGLRDKALEAFPVIENNLEKITTQMNANVERALERSNRVLSDAEESHTKLTSSYQTFLADAEKSRERFSSELEGALKQMSERSSQEFSRHGELIESAAREAQKTINDSWAQSMERTNEQFENFDQQMQQELTRSLALLGQNLASISEKFVSDYTPLTQRLQELVSVARGTN